MQGLSSSNGQKWIAEQPTLLKPGGQRLGHKRGQNRSGNHFPENTRYRISCQGSYFMILWGRAIAVLFARGNADCGTQCGQLERRFCRKRYLYFVPEHPCHTRYRIRA